MNNPFSINSDNYLHYRPGYPDELVALVSDSCRELNVCIDCGTGSGQLALLLAKKFKNVFGLDISQEQLNHAKVASNITYINDKLENTHFEKGSIDLITVAQAIHWFDFEPFYNKCKYYLKPEGVIALIGYDLLRTESEGINHVLDEFYWETIHKYWPRERKWIEEAYKTLPFPFQEVYINPTPITLSWSYDHLVGYLQTWSAVKAFKAQHQFDPVDLIQKKLSEAWSWDINILIKVQFPILLRLGKSI